MRKFLVVLMASLFLFTTSSFSQQINCGPRDKILQQFVVKAERQLLSKGINVKNQILEVYIDKNENWIILLNFPKNGIILTCLVDQGQYWDLYKFKKTEGIEH